MREHNFKSRRARCLTVRGSTHQFLEERLVPAVPFPFASHHSPEWFSRFVTLQRNAWRKQTCEASKYQEHQARSSRVVPFFLSESECACIQELSAAFGSHTHTATSTHPHCLYPSLRPLTRTTPSRSCRGSWGSSSLPRRPCWSGNAICAARL